MFIWCLDNIVLLNVQLICGNWLIISSVIQFHKSVSLKFLQIFVSKTKNRIRYSALRRLIRTDVVFCLTYYVVFFFSHNYVQVYCLFCKPARVTVHLLIK